MSHDETQLTKHRTEDNRNIAEMHNQGLSSNMNVTACRVDKIEPANMHRFTAEHSIHEKKDEATGTIEKSFNREEAENHVPATQDKGQFDQEVRSISEISKKQISDGDQQELLDDKEPASTLGISIEKQKIPFQVIEEKKETDLTISEPACHFQHSFFENKRPQAQIDSRYQSLFENLDKTLTSCVENQDINDTSSLHLKRTKLCFAAMAVVFSSSSSILSAPLIAPIDQSKDEETIHNFDEDDDIDSASLLSSALSSHHQTRLWKHGSSSNHFSSRYSHQSSRKPFYSDVISSTTINEQHQLDDPIIFNIENEDDIMLQKDAPHRPPIPLPVITMLWRRLLLTKGGLSSPSSNPSGTTSSAPTTTTPKSIDLVLKQIQHSLVNELGLVDVVTHFEDPPLFPTAKGSNQQTNLNQQHSEDNDYAFGDDDAEQICLRINNDIHLLYGHYLAKNFQDLFFLDDQALQAYIQRIVPSHGQQQQQQQQQPPITPLTDEVTKAALLQWDPEVEINRDMADACLDCIHSRRTTHVTLSNVNISSSFNNINVNVNNAPTSSFPPNKLNEENEPSVRPISSLKQNTGVNSTVTYVRRNNNQQILMQYEYAIEMLPWHMMRSGRNKQAIQLLTDESFVLRDRLLHYHHHHNASFDYFLLEGTRMHIADVEELYERLLQGKHDQQTNNYERMELPDVDEIMLRCYQIVSQELKQQQKCETFLQNHSSDKRQNDEKDVQEKPHNKDINFTFDEHTEDDLFISVEIAQSFQLMGVSLSSHGLNRQAMKYFSRALVRLEHVHSILLQHELARNESRIDHSLPTFKRGIEGILMSLPLDHIQYLMAETLHGMSFVHEWRNQSTEAMLCYERALSFYSRQRSQRHMKGVAKTLGSMGILHFHLKEYNPALSCFNEALELWRILHQSQHQSLEDDVLGNSNIKNGTMEHSVNGDDDSTVYSYDSSRRGLAGLDEVGDLLQWMGNIRRELGMQTEAISLFTEALYNKIVIHGKDHPDVGLIHQSMGIVHDDLMEFDKSMEHYNEALRIRRANLKNAKRFESQKQIISQQIGVNSIEQKVPSVIPVPTFNLWVTNKELAVAETLQCIGNVCRAWDDHEKAFTFYLENTSIHRNHVLALASVQDNNNETITQTKQFMMMNDILSVMKRGTDGATAISFFYETLMLSLRTSRQLVSKIEEQMETNLNQDLTLEEFDHEQLLELQKQASSVLADIGMIHGAQYLYDIEEQENYQQEGEFGNELLIEHNLDVETERFKARIHLEESISMRKKRIKLFDACQDSSNEIVNGIHQNLNTDYDNVFIAYTLFELGKLFSSSVLMKNKQQQQMRRMSLSSNNVTIKECRIAIKYFQEAREIFRDKIEQVDSFILLDDDQSLMDGNNVQTSIMQAKYYKMPSVFEEMLQTMAVMYRNMDMYDKAVECYNEVSFLLTRMELGSKQTKQEDQEKNIEEKEDTDQCLNHSEEFKILNQKDKVASSSHAIGDILFDTGEYSRALKSYNEALQLRRSIEKDSLEVANTLCCIGAVRLKLKNWDESILCFDEALRIRVDRLDQNHRDISKCFHNIGKAYQGDGKFQEALEYYKKAQRIVSRTTFDTDTDAADLFFDIGQMVITMDHCSVHYGESLSPNDDEYALALSSLTKSLHMYQQAFGMNAVEVANSSCLLGILYAKLDDYSKAISSYEEALRIYDEAPLDQVAFTVKALNCLGHALIQSDQAGEDVVEDDEDDEFEEGRIGKAIAHFDLALRILTENGLVDTEDYASLLHNKGDAFFCIGKFIISYIWVGELIIYVLLDLTQFFFSLFLLKIVDEIDFALTCYDDALVAYKKSLGKDHIKTSVVLERIASCIVRSRDHEEAFELYEEALSVRKQHGKAADLDAAKIQFGMGIVCCEMGHFNKVSFID